MKAKLKSIAPVAAILTIKLLIGSVGLIYLVALAVPLAEWLLGFYVAKPAADSVAVLAIVLILLGAECLRRFLFGRRIRATAGVATMASGTTKSLIREQVRVVSPEVARHEAAHLVAALHFGEPVEIATIVGNDDSEGRVEIPTWNTGDHSVDRSRERLWGSLIIRMAGTVQDQIDGIQHFGSTSDLKESEKLYAPLMSSRYGAGADGYPLTGAELHLRGMIHTKALLETNRPAVDLAAELLIRHEELTAGADGSSFEQIRSLIVQVDDPSGC